MKLELKHLAAYLPYGLKGMVNYDHLQKEYDVELYGIVKDILIIESPFGGLDYYSKHDFKPILHPLSDLTKEITHNGENFVPFYKIKESQQHLFLRTDIEEPIQALQYSEVEKLLSWHFDIYGLIENNLAIQK